MSARILIVDDEINMQVALREVLQRQGHEITVANDGPSALGELEGSTFDLVLSDVRMPEMTGIELLERVRSRWPKLPMIVMTAYGTVEDAVGAMKKGASDYLLKPFSSETVEEIVHRTLQRSQNAAQADEADEEDATASADTSGPMEPIANSPEMQGLLSFAREVADSTATILIQGESGTGKEVLARYIHGLSGRQQKPFVALNCAALPEGLLESELFGHEKGAFTGAVLSRKGKFELANHGTLLLDEVSEMPLALQAKLLRALQEREIDPIGAPRPISLNVRIVATTNRDLVRYVGEGHFREDLFYRLQVITLVIPPLRERKGDIIPLAEYFMRRFARENRRGKKKLSNEMIQYLREQPWRGNVRELENFMERAVLLCKEENIRPDNIFLGAGIVQPASSMAMTPPARSTPEVAAAPKLQGLDRLSSGVVAPSGASPIPTGYGRTDSPEPIIGPEETVTLEEMEKRLILQTLDKVGGNRTRAADILGVSVRTIRNKLNQYGKTANAAD